MTNVTLHAEPAKRLITVIMDKLPSVITGRIKKHEFTTTLGAGVIFENAGYIYNHPVFNLTIKSCSNNWTAQELRELASECQEMAKYLDKITDQK